jgi:hypothetical protein
MECLYWWPRLQEHTNWVIALGTLLVALRALQYWVAGADQFAGEHVVSIGRSARDLNSRRTDRHLGPGDSEDVRLLAEHPLQHVGWATTSLPTRPVWQDSRSGAPRASPTSASASRPALVAERGPPESVEMPSPEDRAHGSDDGPPALRPSGHRRAYPKRKITAIITNRSSVRPVANTAMAMAVTARGAVVRQAVS